METDYQQIMTEVVRKSESEIVLFFVLSIVTIVNSSCPFTV